MRSLLALNLVVAASTALVLVNTVVYVRDVQYRKDTELGTDLGRELGTDLGTDLAMALACFGVGSMIVALTAPRALDRFGDRAVMLTGAALIPVGLAGATALIALGATGGAGWVWMLGLWFLLGAGNSTILTPSSRLLRDASTEATRPYVFTAQFSLSHACYILTYPLAGWVGAAAGLGWAAAALTFVGMIGAAGAFLSWPRQSAAVSPEFESEERSDEQPIRARTQSGA